MLRPLRLWVMYLPQLAACYLLGLLGRSAAIALAGRLGAHNELWADVIMPFAGFARLASFVAMFMVLRSAIPALERLPRTTASSVDIFSNIVAPFFAIYIAWQMLKADWTAYKEISLFYMYGNGGGDKITPLTPGDIPVSNNVWILIIGAFALQYILKWTESRTPKWFIGIRLYLQVFWVFLVASFAANRGLTFILEPSKWFGERRFVVWFNTTKEHLIQEFEPFRIGWAAVSTVWHLIWDVAGMPLLWLVIAGIVYGVASGATWRGVARRVVGEPGAALVSRVTPAQARLQAELQRRLAIAPPTLIEKVWAWIKAQVLAQFGKYGSIVQSARPILHAGLVALSVYILAFVGLAWLSVTDSFYRLQVETGYLTRAFAWLAGWHDEVFWRGPGEILFMLAATLVSTLRTCLVASTYAYCVEKIEAAEAEHVSAEDGQVAAETTATTAPNVP